MPLTKPVILFLGAATLVLAPVLTNDLAIAPVSADKAFANDGNGSNSKIGGSAPTKNNNLFNSLTGNKQANSRNGKGLNDFLNSVFGERKDARTSLFGSKDATQGRSNSASHRLPKAERAKLAAISTVPLASPELNQKDFNAKLGRLNSLKRDYNDYINSNSPHLASVVAYFEATLNYERLAEELAQAERDLIAARTTFQETLADLISHDSFSYDDLTTEKLESRLSALDDTDTSEFTEEQLAALGAEQNALNEALASEEFEVFREAETAFANQENAVDALAQDVSDTALSAALVDMANQSGARQFGDEYVDDEMLDWAKQVLGVGAYYGKIDQIREAAESDDTNPAIATDSQNEYSIDVKSVEAMTYRLRLSLTGK